MPNNLIRMVDIIAKKRNGETHSKDEINFIVDGIKNNSMPNYQVSAWLMAVWFKGMNFEESGILTQAMAKSGDIADLSGIGQYVADKHSTGGVGDKTTLVVVPLLAAAGIPTAKLAGRGLGHTGGTIDKLASIPGFKTEMKLNEFIGQLKTIGAAIASQTAELVPVDGKLYALRDATATVESIPLIAASIMSKKIATDANIIILDVKYGSGAFMKSLDEAAELAETMAKIGKGLNKSITAVITSMEQPLGNAIGNSLEVIEAIETLKNRGPSDLTELCLYLASIAMVKANKAGNIQEGKEILAKYLEDGSALEKFREIIKAQGGDAEIIDNYGKLPAAKFIFELNANNDGYINKLDAFTVAKACKLLGAGRDKKEDPIDYAVGIVLTKKIGDKVIGGEILASISANSAELGEKAVDLMNKAYEISDNIPKKSDLICKIIE